MKSRYAFAYILALASASCGSAEQEPQQQAGATTDAGEAVQPVAAATPAAARATQPAATAAQVGCGAQETTIFSCEVANGKRIAVCGGSGGAEYRYGGDSVEISIPAERWANVAYSGGGETQISFPRGDTRYIVFSRMVRTNFEAGEPNEPAMSDGVIVLQGENVRNLRTCTDANQPGIDIEAIKGRVERADEIFTYETERADRR
ncbi:hypothetical protein [Qipengyuania sp. JC766]|uniref:hypothetical protein n=1 Tax=Qipengyuania sp. JC766 TaxID=3232139 RepID=UPI003459D98B